MAAAGSRHVLIGLGNPLLDICADVGTDLLDKYDLKLNNAILADSKHVPLYREMVEAYKVTYVAGGATQNSIRVAQWMSATPGFGAYIGSIGHDDFGAQLKAAAERDGVSTYYYLHPERPTGTCAVLVHDKERSLVANLSAAEKYSKSEHFDTEAVQSVMHGVSIIYSAGFFLTSSPETMVACGKLAAESGKIYAMNLSAPFLCQFFKDSMLAVMPYADFVFGNESEAAAFGAANGAPDATVEQVALRISALPKASGSRARIVVITQGASSTVVAQDGVVRSIPVPLVPKDAIVDTNGAGDAFVGGFLAHLGKGASIDESVHAGHWAAGHVITKSGCVFDAAAKYPGPPK